MTDVSMAIETVEIYINNGPPLTGSLDVHQDVEWQHSNLPRPNPRWQFTEGSSLSSACAW